MRCWGRACDGDGDGDGQCGHAVAVAVALAVARLEQGLVVALRAVGFPAYRFITSCAVEIQVRGPSVVVVSLLMDG